MGSALSHPLRAGLPQPQKHLHHGFLRKHRQVRQMSSRRDQHKNVIHPG